MHFNGILVEWKEIRGFQHADDEKMGSTFGVQVKMKRGAKEKKKHCKLASVPSQN